MLSAPDVFMDCSSCGSRTMRFRRVKTSYGFVDLGLCDNCDHRRCDCSAMVQDPYARRCPRCHRSVSLSD